MSTIKFLFDKFATKSDSAAVVFRGVSMSYGHLAELTNYQILWLESQNIQAGTPVILYGDYSPLAVCMLLALIDKCCIIIPLTPVAYGALHDSLSEVAPSIILNVTGESPVLEKLPSNDIPDLYRIVIERKAPGLVLFTSGSSGKPKAVVHDFSALLEKFHVSRPSMITLNFLLFDHWGGLNTLLHCLSNLCLIVIPERRTPEYVCELIDSYRIELLPTTPSFLNLLLIGRAYCGRDLSSLKLITYGAEPMSETTLLNLRKVLPNIELRQTYGMIELGVLRVKSRSPDSLWMKLGGTGYNIRVVDNILQIRADSAMLGYINSDSPFTDDGFLITGDLVETDGEWIRVLGRHSDIINVGGQKVYPSEVEAVLLECPLILDAIVYGEPNPILGKIVCADLVRRDRGEAKIVRNSVRQFCRDRLQAYMVPVKIKFVDSIPQSNRLKRIRFKS